MAHDVFISYSVKDRLKSDAICQILEEERIRCWVAPRDISPGGSWAAEIADAIPLSKIMLLVFSQNANNSKQVLREIELAISSDIIIIPVKIEDVLPTGGMSYYLSTTHWIDAVGEKLDSRIQTLADKIKTMLQIDAEPPKIKVIEDKPIKAIPVASAPRPGKKIDSGSKNKNKRKTIMVIATVLAALSILVSGYFLYPYIFKDYVGNNQAESSSPSASMNAMEPSGYPYPSATGESAAVPGDYGLNPYPSATGEPAAVPGDYGLNPSTRVIIEDDSLEAAIKDIFSQLGKPVGDNLTIQDMFNLTCLALGRPGEHIPIAEEPLRPYEYDVSDSRFHYVFNDYEEYLRPDEVVYSIIDSDIFSLAGLQYAYNLKVLSVRGTSISELYPLSILGNLKFIYMEDNNISNLQPLSGLSNLKSLHLGGNLITDISPLSDLTELEFLHIPNNPITDLSVISELTGLRNLVLDGLNIEDLSFISSLDNLEYLDVNNSNISSLEPLSGKTSLLHLGISGNKLVDLSSLMEMPNLKSLYISVSDIGPLTELQNLKYLNLANCSIESIDGLQNLVNLKELYLDASTYDKNPVVIKAIKSNGCIIFKKIPDKN